MTTTTATPCATAECQCVHFCFGCARCLFDKCDGDGGFFNRTADCHVLYHMACDPDAQQVEGCPQCEAGESHSVHDFAAIDPDIHLCTDQPMRACDCGFAAIDTQGPSDATLA